jgi:hypothetical protein
MFQYDVKSTAISAAQTDAPVFAGAARIKGILVGIPSAGGTLTLKNGSAGTTAFTFVTPAIGQSLNVSIPGDGIRCENGIYATTTAGMTATVFYG